MIWGKIGFAILFVSFVCVVPTPRGATSMQVIWTQTSQRDFSSGTLANLDWPSSPGDLHLRPFPATSFGYPAVETNSGKSSGSTTFLSASAAPVSGALVRFRFYSETGCGGGLFCACVVGRPCPDYSFELKVFRSSPPQEKLVGHSPILQGSPGVNEFGLSSPINVIQGDTLGFYLGQNLTIPDIPTIGALPLKNTGNVVGDTAAGTWSCAATNPLGRCLGVAWSVQADVVPQEFGSIVSAVKDTGGFSTWGNVSWNATTNDGSISISTRSSTDAISWSPWASPYTNDSSITSPAARYLQYLAVFNGPASQSLSPVLHSITFSYATIPAPSSILLAVSTQGTTPNSPITVEGIISPPTTANVTLIFTKPDGTNVTRRVLSDSTGFFRDTYSPDQSGTWKVTAYWGGTSQTASAQSAPQTLQVPSQPPQPPSFLQSNLPWFILGAMVVGFGLAVFARRPKAPKTG